MEARRMRRHTAGSGRTEAGERGFALILAILALLLLTFLGLTLATTTSTEMQIANNYRWSQQALYNAEAGIEVGKRLLKQMDWGGSTGVLPVTIRTNPWTGEQTVAGAGNGTSARFNNNDEWNQPTRNWENWQCDKRGDGMGYGVVLDDGGAEAPYQYKTTVFGQTLNGAFTIWVRRPVYAVNEPGCDGCFKDWNANDVLVLTSEGVAPFTANTITSQFGQAYRAMQIIEMTLTSAAGQVQGGCEFYAGQTGLGSGGANFNPCGVGEGRGIVGGLPGATGTGAEADKTAW
jgi:Tfp pilus assembly protein PilX